MLLCCVVSIVAIANSSCHCLAVCFCSIIGVFVVLLLFRAPRVIVCLFSCNVSISSLLSSSASSCSSSYFSTPHLVRVVGVVCLLAVVLGVRSCCLSSGALCCLILFVVPVVSAIYSVWCVCSLGVSCVGSGPTHLALSG